MRTLAEKCAGAVNLPPRGIPVPQEELDWAVPARERFQAGSTKREHYQFDRVRVAVPGHSRYAADVAERYWG